jgi:outer membrane protein OmpA-like peptidoglycan-associated protein
MASCNRIILSVCVVMTGLLALNGCAKKQEGELPTTAASEAAPPPPPPPPPPSADEKLNSALEKVGGKHGDAGWIITLSSARYKPGQTAFEPEDTAKLDAIVEILKGNPHLRILVQAYTDNRGSPERNKELSQQRANAVMRRLTTADVDGGRMQAVGRGEEQPVAPNSTSAGREQNRRIEILFSDADGQFAPAPEAPAKH